MIIQKLVPTVSNIMPNSDFLHFVWFWNAKTWHGNYQNIVNWFGTEIFLKMNLKVLQFFIENLLMLHKQI